VSQKPEVTLYHWPHSRSATALELIEELGAPYRLEVIDITKGVQNEPAFLAINPMGKLPTVKVGDTVVTEQVAIFIYLSDLFPEAGLTPAIDDPLRGPWLRWLVYYAACFEPAMMDKALKREAPQKMSSPYGSFDLVMETVRGQIGKGRYFLGERMTTVDVLWASALGWMTSFGVVEKTPDIAAYLECMGDRPGAKRAATINEKILAQHAS